MQHLREILKKIVKLIQSTTSTGSGGGGGWDGGHGGMYDFKSQIKKNDIRRNR